MNSSLLQTTWVLLGKDLLLEWRTKARLNALVFFAFATLLLFSFALGPDTKLLSKGAGGYLWLSLLFASTLCLGESFRVEAENASLDGLRLAPVDGRALFLAKALGNTLMLVLLGVILLLPALALFDVRLALSPWAFLGVLLLGCLAISGPGTVYSAIAQNARARDVLLPLMLFPLLIPALLSAVKATQLVIHGDPMNQLRYWVRLLLCFDLIYWALGFALFPRVIED